MGVLLWMHFLFILSRPEERERFDFKLAIPFVI